MAKKAAGKGVTSEKIMGFLVEMDERMTNMNERMTEVKESSDAVKQGVEEIKVTVKPLPKAFDRDAKTLMQHERRITIVEHKLGMPTE